MSNIDFQNGFITGVATKGRSVVTSTPDWNENDATSHGYIKNRTHWKEEVNLDYAEFPNIEPDPLIGFIEYGKKIGLEIGKEYTLKAHLKNGTTQTIQAVATEMPLNEIGIAGVPWIYLEDIVTIVDGVIFDLATQTVITGENCYYQYGSNVVDVLEKGVIVNFPHTETIIHKIPNEYLPEVIVDQIFNPESTNAQSGIAVTQIIETYDKSLIVSTERLANNSVTTDKLKNYSITENKLNTGSVTTSKLADKSVDAFKIADDVIYDKHIRNNSITPIKLSNSIPYSKLLDPTLYKTTTVSEDVNVIAEWNTNSIYKMLVVGKIFPTDTENATQKLTILPNIISAGFMHGEPIISIDIPFILDDISKGIEFYAVIESLYTCDVCDLTVWSSGDSSKRVYTRSAIQKKAFLSERGISGFTAWLNNYSTPSIGAGSYIQIYKLEGA
jgi:hypothetical protein